MFTHLRARRLGLPTPTLASYNPFASRNDSYTGPQPAPGGIKGWINDKISAFKNRGNRTAGGAYEEPLNSFGGGGRSGNGRRGFGPLDPDDAWDSRVGTEADAYGPGGYYEEAEVGLHSDTGYAGNVHAGAGSGSGHVGDDRGRGRSREPEAYIGGTQKGLDRRYDEEMGRTAPTSNPFDDDAEPSSASLRGVSPRPMESGIGSKAQKKSRGDMDDSPTERRSMFRENV